MNKKKNNHFVSAGIAQNFRIANSNMWKLDCKTGTITHRNTSKGELFKGKWLWSYDIENAFMETENEVLPLIKEILNTPYNDVPPNCRLQVIDLDKKYLSIFNYIKQAFMLQRKNTPESKEKDEKIFSKILLSDIVPPTDTVFLIQYNSKHFEKTPLLLADSCFIVIDTPSNHDGKLEYSLVYLLPISPYNCLVWGTVTQVDYLMNVLPTPDAINKKRIIQQRKECEVASHSFEYLKKLKDEIPFLNYELDYVQIIAERNYN